MEGDHTVGPQVKTHATSVTITLIEGSLLPGRPCPPFWEGRHHSGSLPSLEQQSSLQTLISYNAGGKI